MNILIKPASGQCNLSCEYCFYCDEMRNREIASMGLMSEQTLKNVIRRTLFSATEPVIYAYQGGEPLLRGLDFYRQALAWQRQYNRQRVPVMNALQTNGTLLDDAWGAFLAQAHVLVGVSVDGTKELHDRYRRQRDGEGSFDRVLKGIGYLDKWKVDYNILTVVTQELAEQVDEVYDFYGKMGWHYQQYIACLDPMEGGARNGLRPDTYGAFLIRLFARWNEDRRQGRAPYIRQFDNYIGILLGYQPESCEQQGVCGIQYAVEADGSVYPCDFYMTDAYLLGNLNQDRLEVLDGQRRRLGFVEVSREGAAACRACRWYALCKGGCRRNREGELASPNRFCESYQMFFEAVYDDMLQAAREWK